MIDWLDTTVASFGRSIGMDGLKLDGDGLLALELERDGRLYVERNGEEALVYLARPWPYGEFERCLAALAACDPGRRLPVPFTAGFCGDDTLVFVARVTREAMNLPMLEEVLATLSRLHETAGG